MASIQPSRGYRCLSGELFEDLEKNGETRGSPKASYK
jgi:hypothetical protein